MSEETPSLAPGRTWIDTHLNHQETEQLVSELMNAAARITAPLVRPLLVKLKGKAPSDHSINAWLENSYYKIYLPLRSSQALSARIAAQGDHGDTSEATRALLRQANLELILSAGAKNPKVLGLVSTIESRLRMGDQLERDLTSKIAKRDQEIAAWLRKEQDWNERRAKAAKLLAAAEKKGGVSKETREALRKELQLL
jgi:hypothetical protein